MHPVAACGGLWRPVAGCGGLWRAAVAPLKHNFQQKG